MRSRPMNREEIRDFLVGRRARIAPEQVGLPGGGRRRVPGLRREEVALLAGVSTDWYRRLENGYIVGVSGGVLDAVASALQLSPEERTYLFDLAQAARERPRRIAPPRSLDVDGPMQWFFDSVTTSAILLRNNRLDIVMRNRLAELVFAPLFTAADGDESPNFARFHFTHPAAREFYLEWENVASNLAALLRAECGRRPEDALLRALVRSLIAESDDFGRLWSSHDVPSPHTGVKRLRHPWAGDLELAYGSALLGVPADAGRDIDVYVAEPGSVTEERMRRLMGADSRSER